MLIKSLRSLLFSAACQAATTRLYEIEQAIVHEENPYNIRFRLDSESYYDVSMGNTQRLITSVHIDHPDPFATGDFLLWVELSFFLQDSSGVMQIKTT